LYIDEYVNYLKGELGDDAIRGDLITLKELERLGCTIQDDYSDQKSIIETCREFGFLWDDENFWWTRSAVSNDSEGVWAVGSDGALYNYTFSNGGVVRPVITINKETILQ
jgi:hypothetical protein